MFAQKGVDEFATKKAGQIWKWFKKAEQIWKWFKKVFWGKKRGQEFQRNLRDFCELLFVVYC
jgi:hypothetical protein